MAFKEVKELRKAGKLEEALEMAKHDLEHALKGASMEVITVNFQKGEQYEVIEETLNVQIPIGILWAKRSLAWVYYEYLKKYATVQSFEAFTEILRKIAEMQMPDDEKLFFESCAWAIGSMVISLHKQEPTDFQKISEVFDLVRDFCFNKPSKAYSFLFKSFHKGHVDWNRYIEFCDWWGFENFMPEDYLKEEYKGQKIMPLVEQAYIGYAKKLLSGPVFEFGSDGPTVMIKELMLEFLPKLDTLIENHPDYQYPPYYKAKILLTLGDHDNSLSAILPFARSKKNEFWVWDVLADGYPKDHDLHLACLCRSMLCKVAPEFMVKVYEKFASALIQRSLFPEAKCVIEKCIQVREGQGWGIPNRLNQWKNQTWYTGTEANINLIPFLKKHAALADELLFSDLPEDLIVTEFVNREKKMLSFVVNRNKRGFFNYADILQSPEIGKIYRVRLKPVGVDGYHHLITVRETDELPDKAVLRTFEGKLWIHENGFGIVVDVFVDSTLIRKAGIHKDDIVKGQAIISYNKKRESWGWKAIRILN